ncbi:Fur family transcriptional regulator [Pararhodospirillum oryzae]|uniref:Fur family transcriptional regulator n=1 Tax=Pararhodospirillum oryzae TaxID=478448 RepID=UPI0024829E0E|nr:Fur family transcriptional regulator [Pararhodospirillum oryzae]
MTQDAHQIDPPSPGGDKGHKSPPPGRRLTPARQRVLDVLRAAPQGHALGAYDILERLAGQGPGRPAPMSVYRALDFLMTEGLVHRLASLNAFVACPHPDTGPHAPQFLICRSCRAVIEQDGAPVTHLLSAAARASDFLPDGRAVVEVDGLCAHCRARESDREQ